jgi:hypothetical protein
MTNYTITVTPYQAAGLAKAVEEFNSVEGGIQVTPETYLSMRVAGVLDSYAAAFDIGSMTSFAFARRFTTNEYEAIMSAAQVNEAVAGYVERLKQSPTVNVTHDECIQGVLALEAAGLIGPGRSAEILAL